MRSLAIIPARGGSKRIPRKNIRDFCGRPMLCWSVETAIRSGCFDQVMVSTDDDEIATTARSAGAEVPFLRSAGTSNDTAPLLDVVAEVLGRFSEVGKSFEQVCCILATAPLLLPEDIVGGRARLEEDDLDAVFSVVRFDYPILRSLVLEGGRIRMNWPEYYSSRSQDLPTSWHDAGMFYWMRPAPCIAAGRIFTERCGGIEVPSLRAQDIDTEDDWAVAESKFKVLRARPASA